MRSFEGRVDFEQILDPAVVTADANCSSVDLKNYGVCRFLVAVGESGDTLSGTVYIELEVEESDDDSSFTDVANAHLSASVTGANVGTFAKIDAPAEDDALYTVEYRGHKRYARVVVNVTGTHTNGTPIAVVAALGAQKVA